MYITAQRIIDIMNKGSSLHFHNEEKENFLAS